MTADKIKTRDQLRDICGRLRARGKTIGFTSGAFDLLHAGHADYLEKAAQLCDVLIAGINTDASVRRYKGEDRPVIPQEQRVRLVAALAAVDYVFTFDERRNRKNIEALRPDLYIKAGDYQAASLTSKELVESLGGRVVLIPVREAVSTSDIIAKIARSLQQVHPGQDAGDIHSRPLPVPQKRAPGLFLDRDGTINEEVMYLHDPDKFRLLPGVLPGVRRFQDMGYRIIIITNQPGIGMGYFTEEDFFSVNREMLKQFSAEGILVDKIYYCPHSKAAGCSCRKPEQGLIKRAAAELNLDLAHSVFVGDKSSDIEAGSRAGMLTVAVNTGFQAKDGEYDVRPGLRVDTLLEAAEKVLEMEQQ